jgi:AAA+ superfamily predicted ATPase
MFNNQIFEDIIEFPDRNAQKHFSQLVGLDEIKDRLIKEIRLLLNPHLLEEWSERHHKSPVGLLEHFQNRPPFFIFGGDIGTGKTSLAESLGDPLARQEKIPVTLYRLSLNARGSGAVGEMTRLLSEAFKEVREAARKGISKKARPSSAVIFVIDEADALAQSREFDQMHHEDRAGVNAVIRGIDTITSTHVPAVIIMCTNRLEAIDPAVKRRAAEIFEFKRPNQEQMIAVLKEGLNGTDITPMQILHLAEAMGPNGGRTYGCTYSDLVRKFLPVLLLDAFPDEPIEYKRALEIAKSLQPTPPFSAKTDKRQPQ